MAPVITSLYAGAFAVLYIVLAYRVTVFRHREKTSLGPGEANSPLTRSIRVHGNFMEYVPFALLLIALVELGGAPAAAVHALAATLLLARVLHAWGLTAVAGRSFQRYWGTALTFTIIVVAGVWSSVGAVQTMSAGAS